MAGEQASERVDGAGPREILALAIPAFLALVAEPLFLLADSAIVGHLGTSELAGLGIAGTVLGMVVALCVFLAYGTTATVARALGAGDPKTALARGIDGIWLALVIGVVVSICGWPLAGSAVRLFGADRAVAAAGTAYLQIAILAAAPMLIMLAATGVLRGLQDTRTPLIVAVAGNALNVVLNFLLVYGWGSWSGWGIAGSAAGTAISQLLSALAMTAVVATKARREGVSLRPDLAGIRASGSSGVPLLLRTLTLRGALLLMTAGAAALGAADLAAMQVSMTLWMFLAFALDALAIAAQALTGRSLGAGDTAGTRAVTDRMIGWGLRTGIASGVVLAAAAFVVGPLFTDDPRVIRLMLPVLLVAALGQPIAGVIFVLDGVLIGAGDGRYLAWAGLVVLVVFIPGWLVATYVAGSLTALWVAFCGLFMGGRYVVLTRRARSDGWMLTGTG